MGSAADRPFALLGFGSPIVDLISAVDDDFLAREIPGGKGGTLHVSADGMRALIARLPSPPRLLAGGSAGNTVFALNRLGVRAVLLGKLCDDDRGRFFRSRMLAAGGSDECLFTAPGEATAACLVLSTPDGERTMRSCLGASLELTPADLDRVDFSACDVLLAEGYMVDAPVFDEVLARAQAAGTRIAFDPGSFEIARAERGHFLAVLDKYADIALFNRAEAAALLGGGSDADLLAGLSRRCPVAVLKLGGEGALIEVSGAGVWRIPAVPVGDPVDTTAAGDMFAAGFFYGMARRPGDWRFAGECGARLAAQVVRVMGAELPGAAYDAIREFGGRDRR